VDPLIPREMYACLDFVGFQRRKSSLEAKVMVGQ
jgi:hypothetical protein